MYSPGLIGRNDSSKPNLYLAGFLLPECSVLAEDEEYQALGVGQRNCDLSGRHRQPQFNLECSSRGVSHLLARNVTSHRNWSGKAKRKWGARRRRKNFDPVDKPDGCIDSGTCKRGANHCPHDSPRWEIAGSTWVTEAAFWRGQIANRSWNPVWLISTGFVMSSWVETADTPPRLLTYASSFRR
jgi:hypothetical protein